MVILCAAYVSHKVDGCLLIKRKQNLINCRNLCPEDVADVLVAFHVYKMFHVFFFGHGKKALHDKALGTEVANTLISDIGRSMPVTRTGY